MNKNEIQKLIAESLYELTHEDVSPEDQSMDTSEFEDSLGSGEEDYEDEDINLGLEPISMSSIDIPIQDKGVFSAMGGNEPYDDEFSDLNGYQEFGDDYEGNYQDDVSVSPGYFNEEEVPMSAIDMPIKDKAIFSAMDGDDTMDDMSDIAKYRRDKGGDYEGGFQDDVSVSPGYYNESEDDMDPIAIAKTNASSNYDPTEDAMAYAGEHWGSLSPQEKEEIFADMENDFARNMGEAIEFTPEELQKIISEGVERLHRKTLIENRLKQINNELNLMADPEAWENAKIEAKAQLAKKSIAWNNISTREDLLSEMSFRDIKMPVAKPIDVATNKAKSKWDNMQKESVSDIMSRASDLMAEAKKKYNDISK